MTGRLSHSRPVAFGKSGDVVKEEGLRTLQVGLVQINPTGRGRGNPAGGVALDSLGGLVI
jgi:hypothetical protein